MQDLKIADHETTTAGNSRTVKMTDQIAGLEFARLKNGGPQTPSVHVLKKVASIVLPHRTTWSSSCPMRVDILVCVPVVKKLWQTCPRSFKVINVGTPGKVVSSACACVSIVYLQAFSR